MATAGLLDFQVAAEIGWLLGVLGLMVKPSVVRSTVEPVDVVPMAMNWAV